MNEWFRYANYFAKQAEPGLIILAQALALGTGLYPRDILIKAIAGTLYEIQLPDGSIIAYRPTQVEPTMWNGIKLSRTTNLPIASSTFTFIPWQSLDLDQGLIWNPLDPNFIIIPDEVAVVEITAGVVCANASARAMGLEVVRSDGVIIASNSNSSMIDQAGCLTTGPIPVVIGERYGVRVWFSGTVTVLPRSQTFVSATVLGTN